MWTLSLELGLSARGPNFSGAPSDRQRDRWEDQTQMTRREIGLRRGQLEKESNDNAEDTVSKDRWWG